MEQSYGSSLLVRSGLNIVLLFSVCGSIIALLLLFVATHLNSRCFALAVLVVLLFSAWYAMSKRFRWRLPRFMVVLLSIVLVVCLLVLAKRNSPTGMVTPESCITSVYRGAARFCRFSPAWLVDEADQVRLGALLLPYIDPFMSSNQGKCFADTFNAAYAELGQSDNFAQIGSAMGEAYADMFFQTDPVGHAYVYHPSGQSGKRCPVIVFLHGWLGNMKAYVWSWSRFAEQHGCVVVCPTFLNGVWKGPHADEMLRWLDGVIREDPMCDVERVFVVGLSNGGTGVIRWASVLPETYCGLVMVSAVMKNTDSPEFVSTVNRRSILVVYGGEDNRIRPEYVEDAVVRMKEKGLQVRAICYREDDHVLVLSARNRLQADLLSWMSMEP